MSKELETLKDIKQNTDICFVYEHLNGEDNSLEIIEKALKALDIIKETFRLSFDDEELTIGIDNVYFLTFKNKEKYDLLKEVLL